MIIIRRRRRRRRRRHRHGDRRFRKAASVASVSRRRRREGRIRGDLSQALHGSGHGAIHEVHALIGADRKREVHRTGQVIVYRSDRAVHPLVIRRAAALAGEVSLWFVGNESK